MKLGTVVAVLTGLTLTGGAQADEGPDRDPRNWPTVTRLVADRHALVGRAFTLRVHARATEYYNCGYRRAQDRLMAFSLLGGPLETMTGYMPRELGQILASLLERDPWLPITVQVRYDPAKMDDLCPAQVDIVKWARGWQYPEGSLTPGRPDPTLQPKPEQLEDPTSQAVWRALLADEDAQGGAALLALTPGSEVELLAGARLSASYSCVFQGGERTHHALRLHDGRGRFVHAYLPRTAEARALIDFVTLHRNIALRVKGQVRREAMSHYCANQLEITSWSIPTATPAAGPST